MDKYKIPNGIYCYDENGTCPYWQKRNGKVYCAFLEKDEDELDSLILWDQCKECGVNDEED